MDSLENLRSYAGANSLPTAADFSVALVSYKVLSVLCVPPAIMVVFACFCATTCWEEPARTWFPYGSREY